MAFKSHETRTATKASGMMGLGCEERRRKEHIVLLPFMAQGHFSAFLALVKFIEETRPGEFTFTIVNTPVNVDILRSSLPPTTAFNFKVLPFHGPDHGLPPGAENTDSLPYHFIVYLFQASRSLRPHFDGLISDIVTHDGCPPFCIIADFFFGWAVDVAREHGVFHATFPTCGAFGFAAYYSLWLHLPHLNKKEDEDFGLPGFPETYRLRRNQMSEQMKSADGKDPWSVFLKEQVTLSVLNSNGILCNTVEEMEKSGLEVLQRISGRRVWPVGPLLLGGGGGRPRLGKEAGISIKDCMRWLDDHPTMSVLYVSFGSQNTITPSQMLSLATGLERSNHSFLWVVRPPLGFDLKGEFRSEWLPEGFEERMREQGRGLVVRNWAPQPEILGHKAVGAFLTHCGWNSVLESLSEGVPMIGWPLAAEQFYNVKMLEEEMGVCVEVARGLAEAVDVGLVETVVREVMGGEKGTEMRRRAAEMKEVMRSAVVATVTEEGKVKRGSSLTALDDLLETARSHGNRRSSFTPPS